MIKTFTIQYEIPPMRVEYPRYKILSVRADS